MDRSLFILRLFCWSSLWLVGLSFPHQFHFVKEFKSWTEAQSICRKKYTDLATVDDMEDMRRLLESVNGTYNGSVWLGLYDDIEKSWRWSLEDPEFYKEGEKDFRNWVTTQSNVFQREPVCVMFKDGVWHFFPCETQLSFVCFDGEQVNCSGFWVIL
ncbi:P-selectin-like [Hoplias malabaricus]|uniref:P-selectin-like n=1 Tax=Hoplias malabaricus TaxID=27720 RepID=UPI003461896E